MAAKIPLAQKRLFANIFVCKDCKKRIRSQATRVIKGEVKCPKCGGRSLRPVRKK